MSDKPLAVIGVYGDIHLCSKNYGGHIDYPAETIHYLHKITELTEQNELTHLIGLGDLTYGRIHSLEYREKVEKELEKQFKLVNGNRFELKGNHDSATYGMTEYEYYLSKGLIKGATNLSIGKLNLSMLNFGELFKKPILEAEEEKVNMLCMHDYIKFKETQLPNFGYATDIDDIEKLYNVNFILAGHIHEHMLINGYVRKDGVASPCMINYLGSMSRPSYRDLMNNEKGYFVIITVQADGAVDYKQLEVELLPVEECFNLAEREAENEKKELKEKRLDVSDIVQQLNSHERQIGNPEEIILGLNGIEKKYRDKAIQLLKDSI